MAERASVVWLTSLTAQELPVLAAYMGCDEDALVPMLEASVARLHNGHYYAAYCVYAQGMCAGFVSLMGHEDGTVSQGVDVFPAFRRQGIGLCAVEQLAAIAARQGFATLTAQVRTDNAASIALHRRAGFTVKNRRINRRGNEVFDMEKTLCTPMRHEMSLRPKPFAAIADGSKRYELRLQDEKRRAIRVGDEILFTCTEDGRTVLTRVTGLYPFVDFTALYAALPLTECGYTPENVARAHPRDMERYYLPEKQALYGVLAIGVARVRYPLAVLAMQGLELRELSPADVPEMLRLARGNPLYYQHMGIIPDEQGLLETLTALPPRRTMADKHFFGWFEGSRLVAMMDLIARHPQEDMAFIGWFMVDAERQGYGLGRRLVTAVMEMLSRCGVREVRLGRVAGNPQSEAFWRACGFQDTSMGYDADAYHVTVMSRMLK